MFRALRYLCIFLLCLTLAGWLRSYRFADGVEVIHKQASFHFSTRPGQMHLRTPSRLYRVNEGAKWGFDACSVRQTAVDPLWRSQLQTPGFYDQSSLQFDGINFHLFTLSFWPVAAILSAWPSFWLVSIASRARRSRNLGLCRVCGYDLRATPGKCPECGNLPRVIPMRRRWTIRAAGASALAGVVALIFWLGRHDFRGREVRPLDFATLNGFTFDDQGGEFADVPESIRQLNGQRITIDGVMLPIHQDDTMVSFALLSRTFTREYMRLPETIIVRNLGNMSLGYCPDPIRVRGKLHVAPVHDKDYLVGIYWLDAEEVSAVPPDPPAPTPEED